MTFPGIEHDPTAPQVNPDLLAVEELRKAREAEYSVWVAVQNIPWGTVLAATPGMAVPASTVERLKWDQSGYVVKRTSKAGREVLERTGAATTEERERWAAEDKAAAENTTATAASTTRTRSPRRRSTASTAGDASTASTAPDQTTTTAPDTAADTEGGDS
ncbi:hypothetical protein [Micromonospora aurantiaca (nom. illeg.)]|uniref:hypothetical protein n=1 Tax=Micromonospora aurantiaca (nom. illeg.) TaxID=47850 RepID=UPI0011A04B1F